MGDWAWNDPYIILIICVTCATAVTSVTLVTCVTFEVTLITNVNDVTEVKTLTNVCVTLRDSNIYENSFKSEFLQDESITVELLHVLIRSVSFW